jgi:quercetin dioxygenase-like cupin family protein
MNHLGYLVHGELTVTTDEGKTLVLKAGESIFVTEFFNFVTSPPSSHLHTCAPSKMRVFYRACIF